MSDPARPARPHHTLTPDGRVMREVLSYSRRGHRLLPSQQAVWDAHHEAWVIPDEAAEAERFDVAAWFGREAPLVVEIGSGVGQATVATALARPGANVLAFEVWQPGVADTLVRLAKARVSNVRLFGVDAAWSFAHLLGPESVAEVHTFFPDPWHKSKHQKRRLVNAEFASVVATRLVPGGVWRLATDWADYAEQMIEVLDAEPALEGGVVPRFEQRPVTKFERKGLEKGREITDLAYTRA